MPRRQEVLLADADVLIDYSNSNLSVLGLVARHIGKLYVLRQVLDTVDALTVTHCKRHGITVIEADTATLLKAGKLSGPLSFEDWICYLLCEQKRWTCVTNDRKLIQVCQEAGINIRRGLGLMVELVAKEHMTRAKALRTARTIHKNNPYHIDKKVLERFINALDRK